MIKSVVFDLGGVLLGRNFNDFGTLASEEFSFLAGDNFPQCWREFDRGTMSQQQVAVEFAELNGCTVERAHQLINKVLHLLSEIPECVELVKKLKERGYKLYVLSNMPREYYDHIKQFEVLNYFDGVLISSHEGLIKPDPRIFGLLLDRYDLTPSETLFIDDKAANTDMAAQLGIQTIQFDLHAGGIERVLKALSI